MTDKTESLTETLAKQAEARFSASAAIEKDQRAWIASVLPKYRDQCESSSTNFQSLLKDGILLCELINKLAETQVAKFSTMNLPFKQMENISSYLTACERLGMSQTELFETSDLFAAKNLQLVLQNICALHNYVTKHGGTLREKAEKSSSGKLTSSAVAKRTPTKAYLGEDRSSRASSPGAGGTASPSSSIAAASSSSTLFGSALSSPSSSLDLPSRPKAPSVASLAADIATKEEFKYNPEVESAAQRWIERVVNIQPTGLSFFSFLKSGVILCKLANAIQPNAVNSIYEGNLPYRQMENIGSYITACQHFGLRDVELFETADLFTQRNLNNVVNHIHCLANFLVKRPGGWSGPQMEDVRDAKSLFSATLVEENWDKISSSNTPLTDEQKELLAWANNKLKDAIPPTEMLDLSSDVKTGVKLIRLLGAICRGQSVGIYNATPTLIWHAMQNASAILAFVASQTFEKVDGVRAVDIVTGNVTAIARLLFYLREKFDLDYLFAQTLGSISATGSAFSDASDFVEIEIMEGEDVPEHLRPLLSAEDLQLYDRLARERREEDARIALSEAESASSSSSTSTASTSTNSTTSTHFVASNANGATPNTTATATTTTTTTTTTATTAAPTSSAPSTPTSAAPILTPVIVTQSTVTHVKNAVIVSPLATETREIAPSIPQGGTDESGGQSSSSGTSINSSDNNNQPDAKRGANTSDTKTLPPSSPSSSVQAASVVEESGHQSPHEVESVREEPSLTSVPVLALNPHEEHTTSDVPETKLQNTSTTSDNNTTTTTAAPSDHTSAPNHTSITESSPSTTLSPTPSSTIPPTTTSPSSTTTPPPSTTTTSPSSTTAISAVAIPPTSSSSPKPSRRDSLENISTGSPGKKRRDKTSKEKTSSSSGTSTPKLRDSSDSIELTRGDSSGSLSSHNTPRRSKTKTRLRDKAGANAATELAGEVTTTPSDQPSTTSAATRAEGAPLSTVATNTETSTVDRIADSTSANSTHADLVSRSASSDNHGSPPAALQTSRQHSHTRERSIPRKINIKRTTTVSTNAALSEQDKVLKAQQVVRKHVALETLTTEQSYLNSLKTIITDLIEPVKRSKVMTTDEFNSLFSNMEVIANDHMRFEQLLKQRIGNWENSSGIADLFLKETSFFSHYGAYLENYNKGTVALHFIRKKYPKFDQMIKGFEDEMMKTTMLTIDSFLIMPVQRLPRYRLLLSDMKKYTPTSWQEHVDLQRAVDHIDAVLRELNSNITKDGAEQTKKMIQIGNSIQGDFPILKSNRVFVREGAIVVKKLKIGDKTKPEKKKIGEKLKGLKAYAFLFNDCLVLCEQLKHAKSEDKHQFAFVHSINLNDTLVLSEKERSEKNMDQIANFTIKHVDKKAKDVIIYMHTESDLYVFHTTSPDDREAWQKVLVAAK